MPSGPSLRSTLAATAPKKCRSVSAVGLRDGHTLKGGERKVSCRCRFDEQRVSAVKVQHLAPPRSRYPYVMHGSIRQPELDSYNSLLSSRKLDAVQDPDERDVLSLNYSVRCAACCKDASGNDESRQARSQLPEHPSRSLHLTLEATSFLAPAHIRPSSIPKSQLSDRRVRHPFRSAD